LRGAKPEMTRPPTRAALDFTGVLGKPMPRLDAAPSIHDGATDIARRFAFTAPSGCVGAVSLPILGSALLAFQVESRAHLGST